MKDKPRKRYLLMFAAGLAGICFFLLLMNLDNKYRWPGPKGVKGEMDWCGQPEDAITFLSYGWEVFEDQLLSPDELRESNQAGSRFLYLGQFGGFEFGDSSREPTGAATYRLRILLDSGEREYALELPEIFSAYRLWVNGRLMQSMGNPDPESYREEVGNAVVTFFAEDEAELVIETANYSSFYSGMIYPPAFGASEAVSRLITIRLLTHCAAASLAVFLGVVCLCTHGERTKKIRRMFFFLCACFAGCIIYPVIHTLNIQGNIWYIFEKVGVYGMILSTVCLVGMICKVPLSMRTVMFGLGASVCVMVFVFPVIPGRWDVEVMRLYSLILRNWQWLAASYLAAVILYYCREGAEAAMDLVPSVTVFVCALYSRCLNPLFEPAYTGWPIEWGGMILILTIAFVLLAESRWAYEKRQELGMRIHMAEEYLDFQKERTRVLTRYVKQTGVRNHEAKKTMELLHYYYQNKDFKKLGNFIEELYKRESEMAMPGYAANPLIHAVCASRFKRAEQSGICIDHNLINIPSAISMSDADLWSFVANLLDNAIEGCERLPEKEKRWIHINMQVKNGYLSLEIENSADDPPVGWKEGVLRTEKEDGMEHGYGLWIVSDILKRYKGIDHVKWEKGIYSVHAAVCLMKENGSEDET